MNSHLFDVHDPSFIVVSTSGNDSRGKGSFTSPIKTLTKAFSLATAARPTIFMLPGEYAEAAMITWPNVSNLKVISLGDVSISAPLTTAAVITINPAATGTFIAGLQGVTIEHSGAGSTQKGILINNTNQTANKKMIVTLKDVAIGFDDDGTGDSITVVGGQAANVIRLYMSDCDEIEGLVKFTVTNADDVITIKNCALTGGLTTVGTDGYLLLFGCIVLTSALTMTVTNHTYKGCTYRIVSSEGSYAYTFLTDVPAS
jgi:hypothetical protein